MRQAVNRHARFIQAFEIAEEEEAIVQDRPAERSAEDVLVQLRRLGRIAGGQLRQSPK